MQKFSEGGIFMDIPEYYWDYFMNTGNIDAYLSYKNFEMYNGFNFDITRHIPADLTDNAGVMDNKAVRTGLPDFGNI